MKSFTCKLITLAIAATPIISSAHPGHVHGTAEAEVTHIGYYLTGALALGTAGWMVKRMINRKRKHDSKQTGS